MKSLLLGDCLEVLKNYPDNHFDSCITDPPYGMGMDEWDGDVPTVEIWREVLRVLKPGAFCLSFCSPELYHRMATKVEEAGFVIKDQVMWMTTTKMAKHNRLKPAHEPIAVAQKPFKGTIIANVEKWGTGKIDTESTRVPWELDKDGQPKVPTGWVKGGHSRRAFGKTQKEDYYAALGVDRADSIEEIKSKISQLSGSLSDDLLEPYAVLTDDKKKKAYDAKRTTGSQKEFGKEGGNPAGRYPSNIIGEVQPEHQKYFYAPRATRKEKGAFNDHPTVKPVSLMEYLIKVYAPEGGLILDPFCGSGTTLVAAENVDRQAVGIDKSPDYIEISKKRLEERSNA
jgi:site-specific DNA-methyltransferase (adenine-specific)